MRSGLRNTGGNHEKELFGGERSEAEETLAAITREVNRQQRDYYRIFSEKILPELNRQNVYLYQNEKPEPFHEEFVHNFFNEEVSHSCRRS